MLADAIAAIAAHFDVVSDRLNQQAEKESDVGAAFGEELSRLRAEVLHLRGIVARLEQQDG